MCKLVNVSFRCAVTRFERVGGFEECLDATDDFLLFGERRYREWLSLDVGARHTVLASARFRFRDHPVMDVRNLKEKFRVLRQDKVMIEPYSHQLVWIKQNLVSEPSDHSAYSEQFKTPIVAGEEEITISQTI